MPARRAVADDHVIRYDLRDTGRSVTWEACIYQYCLHDFAGDVLRLLDSLRVIKGNLVGFGSGVGQPKVAIEHPDRADPVALISPSPVPAW